MNKAKLCIAKKSVNVSCAKKHTQKHWKTLQNSFNTVVHGKHCDTASLAQPLAWVCGRTTTSGRQGECLGNFFENRHYFAILLVMLEDQKLHTLSLSPTKRQHEWKHYLTLNRLDRSLKQWTTSIQTTTSRSPPTTAGTAYQPSAEPHTHNSHFV